MSWLSKPTARWALLLSTTLLLRLIAGCAENKQTTGASADSANPPAATESAADATIFPHPADWEKPSGHGSAMVRHGKAACLACHQEGPASVGPPPTCQLCHALYPHQNGWVAKSSHGAWVLAHGGKQACATQCHGTDLQGGLSGVACATCHNMYPHAANWNAATVHGAMAKGTGKELCKGCHGADLQGGQSGVSCTQCHKQYPHAVGWKAPAAHGVFVASDGTNGCATACHGSDLKGGLSGVACDSCHKVYPHPADWDATHPVTIAAIGIGACQGCHGADFTALLNGKNCYSCHADYPHPAESVWVPFTGGHGARVKTGYAGSTAECQKCHGADLQTKMTDGRNCSSCHPSYPHPDKAAWEIFSGHAQYTLGHTKTECQLCHGEGYDGGTRANPSCFSCHGGAYPHLSGWAMPSGQPQEHAKFVQKNGTSSCATANCHGVALVPKPKVTQGPSCNNCHQSYPHAAGWKAGTVHGPVAMAAIDTCKQCHGATLDKAPPGFQSCKDCHASYGQHDTAKPAVFGWGLKGHGQYVLTPIADRTKKLTECVLCHGAAYTGGLSNKSCKSSSCHASYPHSAGWKSGVNHGTTAVANIDQCKMCHGAGLNIAPTGFQSCTDCHVSYLQHKTAKTGVVGWGTAGHGTYFLTPATDKAKKLIECQSCHAATYATGIANKKACKTCHTYPHDDPKWAAETHGTTVHAAAGATTLAKAQGKCSLCHGPTLTGGAVGVSCNQCHATYPHAATGWAAVWQSLNTTTAHGKQYLIQKGLVLEDGATAPTPPPPVTCEDCHGAAVNFTSTDTKTSLKQQNASPFAPTCYACHWAYPHMAWIESSTWKWAPVVVYNTDSDGKPCGKAMGSNFGHTVYLDGSPLLVNAAGQRPDPATGPDALWTSAIQNTCGGSVGGSCHFNGNRSFNLKAPGSAACGQSCHGQALPLPPKYPACPTPPPPPPTPCDPTQEEC